MKKSIHKLAVNSTFILFASLPICSEIQATENKNPNSVSSIPKDNSAQLHKLKALAEHNQQIVNTAKEAVMGTQQALLNLEKNDSANALTSLQEVSKKLEQIMANSPALVLVAADIEVDVIDFKGSAGVVEQKVKQAANLLNHGKLQAGRMVADELASEMDITTVNIPLKTYPLAIKDAIGMINAGKTQDAMPILDEALNSLVEETEIIPLPLLRAEGLLLKASELEQKTDLSKENNRDEVLKLVAEAKEKIKIAQLLGYGEKDDYQLFYKVIDDIKTTVHTEKSAATWAKIKQAFADLKNKVTPGKK
jgi:hypothetical protein